MDEHGLGEERSATGGTGGVRDGEVRVACGGRRASQEPVEEAQIADAPVAAGKGEVEKAIEGGVLADAAVRPAGMVIAVLIEGEGVE